MKHGKSISLEFEVAMGKIDLNEVFYTGLITHGHASPFSILSKRHIISYRPGFTPSKLSISIIYMPLRRSVPCTIFYLWEFILIWDMVTGSPFVLPKIPVTVGLSGSAGKYAMG